MQAILDLFKPQPKVAVPIKQLARVAAEVFPHKKAFNKNDITFAWERVANMMFKTPYSEFQSTASIVWDFSLSMMAHSDNKYAYVPVSTWKKLVEAQKDFPKIVKVFDSVKDDPHYAGLAEDRARRVMAVFARRFAEMAKNVSVPPETVKAPKPARRISLPPGLGAFPA